MDAIGIEEKRWHVDDKSIWSLCAETSKTVQQCYDFAGRHVDTIIGIK